MAGMETKKTLRTLTRETFDQNDEHVLEKSTTFLQRYSAGIVSSACAPGGPGRQQEASTLEETSGHGAASGERAFDMQQSRAVA
jgi:hypothetical protein